MISPQLIIYAVIALAVTAYFGHCEYVKKDRAQFIAKLEVQAEEQKRKIDLQVKNDKLAKEKADAQSKVAHARIADLSKRLRDERSRSGILPPAAPGSPSPDRITFQRPDVERAISTFVEGTARLLDQGDKAITDLNTAKHWSNSVLRLRLSGLDSLPSSKPPER